MTAMISKTIYATLLCLSSISLFAQTNFSYSINLEAVSITGLPGLHSYAHAQHLDKWVLIGGRLDGIHARQPFNAFPESQNNTVIYVVNPTTGELWSSSVLALPVALREQLQATNMEFFQDGEQLIIVGGYAYSASEGDHITFPYLTVVNIPALIDHIVNAESISADFLQITNDQFAVTGGYLGKIGDTFYLIGGHRFDGRYNPMNHPTFTQTYVDGLRKFSIATNDDQLIINDLTTVSDPVHLHRRDYNLMPQVFPDGSLGYTLFSGVFQVSQDLPYLYPVDITASGHQPITEFNQYLSNYHSAHIALFDESQNTMHNLFFGGMSQYYFNGTDMVQDDNVPFVKTISRVSRDADGNLEEVRLPIEMPAYLGSSAELLINPTLPMIAPDIVDLPAIDLDTVVLGHIFGGIYSPTQHPFTTNSTGVTSAATNLYQVRMIKHETTATVNPLPGYHAFTISVFPNPSEKGIFQLQANIPEAGTIDLFMVDTTGRLIKQLTREVAETGDYKLGIHLPDAKQGLYLMTAILNGKYAATASIVFK